MDPTLEPDLPFAVSNLERERYEILERMLELEVADSTLHEQALSELERRMDEWHGSEFVPGPSRQRRRFILPPGPIVALPIVLKTDPIELLILRALSSDLGRYGVANSGAPFSVGDESNPKYFVSFLSPLLDEASIVFRQLCRRPFSAFLEKNECFYDDVTEPGKYQPFAVVGSEKLSSIADRSIDAFGNLLDAPVAPRVLVNFDIVDRANSGLLSDMGYHVGRTKGLAPTRRREILERAFEVEMVSTSLSPTKGQSWGGPRSEVRLDKIASSLRTFIAEARGRHDDMSDAISDWQSDLKWLSSNFGYFADPPRQREHIVPSHGNSQ